jgi:hypothetical protein
MPLLQIIKWRNDPRKCTIQQRKGATKREIPYSQALDFAERGRLIESKPFREFTVSTYEIPEEVATA